MGPDFDNYVDKSDKLWYFFWIILAMGAVRFLKRG